MKGNTRHTSETYATKTQGKKDDSQEFNVKRKEEPGLPKRPATLGRESQGQPKSPKANATIHSSSLESSSPHNLDDKASSSLPLSDRQRSRLKELMNNYPDGLPLLELPDKYEVHSHFVRILQN